MTSSIITDDSAATERFGEQLGRRLKGGEVIELISDLGGGKTTLTRGIVRGAGSSDVVGSPTFTLSKVYKTQKFDIHHFDFFRLKEAGLMEHELASMFEDREAVLVLEWSDVVQHTLPTSRLTVTINKTSDTSRELLCIYPKTLSYLMET